MGCTGEDDRDFTGDRRDVESNVGRHDANSGSADIGAPSDLEIAFAPPLSPSLSLESLVSSAVLLLSVTRRLFRAISRNHSKGSSPTRRRTRRGSLSGMPSPASLGSLLPNSRFWRIVSKNGLHATY